jgi:hypothetical protein
MTTALVMAISSSHNLATPLGLVSALTTLMLLVGREVAYHSGRFARAELRKLDLVLTSLAVLALIIVVQRFMVLTG